MSKRHYSQRMDNEGAWLDGKLVWRNPTPGNWTNLNVQQAGGQVWVNGELVYDDEVDNQEHVHQKYISIGDGAEKLFRMGLVSKWLLALSNLVAIWPIIYCSREGDALLLVLACCISFVHHAAEMRYYAPNIIHLSPRVRWWLWKADQAGAVVAILGLGSLGLLRQKWISVTTALLFMLGSEAVMYAQRPIEWQIEWRTMLHITWHFLSLGWIAYLAVTIYADEERLYQTLFAWLVK